MKNASEDYMAYLDLYERGFLKESSAKLDDAARALDPLALHTLGYEAEESDPPRIREALKLYKMAARQGYEPSIMNLARYYESHGNARWYLHWLKMAANMGSPDAIQELNRPFPYLVSRAILGLEAGEGIDHALSVFRLAARHGNVDAMNNLANLYDIRLSPPRRGLAVRLYKNAIAKGSKMANINLARHYADLEQHKKYRKYTDITRRLNLGVRRCTELQ